MSAIIDRASAAKAINEAEATIEQSGDKINKLLTDIYNLSGVIKAHTGTPMYEAMISFHDSLKSIGNSLEARFTSTDGVNSHLMQLVNNSGDTDGSTYSLNVGGYVKITATQPRSSDVTTGIGNLSDIGNSLQSYANNMHELEEVFSATVLQYQTLYNLAQEGPHDTIGQNAHDAAETVRDIAQEINSRIVEFSNQLNNHIDYWAEKNNQIDAASKAAIDVCKGIAKDCVIKLPLALN